MLRWCSQIAQCTVCRVAFSVGTLAEAPGKVVWGCVLPAWAFLILGLVLAHENRRIRGVSSQATIKDVTTGEVILERTPCMPASAEAGNPLERPLSYIAVRGFAKQIDCRISHARIRIPGRAPSARARVMV